MKKIYFLLLAFIGIGYVSGIFALEQWKKAVYGGDSLGYYLHVVSFFVNQDVGDYDKSITTLQKVQPRAADPRKDKYGIRLTPIGRRYIKYTLGAALMETPLFLLGHAYAKWSNKYEANGWTKPYLLSVSLSTTFYVLLGFYLLISLLTKYFSDRVVVLTILIIAFATNLFFHSTFMTMAHGFLFFQHCLLIWLTERFYRSPSRWKMLGLGMVVGLIAITRVPEVVSALFVLLWGIRGFKSLWERIQWYLINYNYILFAAFGFLLVFSIQISYWYYVSGQLFFDPYKGEGFNFLNPMIFSGWFHYSNGWLIYTPVMFFSLLGWFFLRKFCPEIQWALFGFVLLHIWIHYSYYAWTYFPGLGSRPMIETYPYWSFAMAACLSTFFKWRWTKWMPYAIILFFTTLNLFHTWQMKRGLIWSERGNKGFYWSTLFKTILDRNDLIAYESKQIPPDSSDIQKVQQLFFEDFEGKGEKWQTDEIVYDGQFAMTTAEEHIFNKQDFDLRQVHSGDWIHLGVHAYMRAADHNYDRNKCGILIIQFLDKKGKPRKTREIKIAPFLGNPTHSFWSAGDPKIWGEAYYYCKVPFLFGDGWTMKVKIWNPHKQRLYYDNLYVDLYRDK